MANPSTRSVMDIQALLQQAYANGTYEAVTRALRKRIITKKKLASGKAVDKIEGFNAMNATLEEEIKAAVKAENQRRARAKARTTAKEKAEAPDDSKPLISKNPFSAAGAALELTRSKNKPLTY